MLTAKKDYKTLNISFSRYQNASKFDTRSLNEDIPQKNKPFYKRNEEICNENKFTPRTQTVQESDAYEARPYNPNNCSYGYVNKFHDPSYTGLRIRSRYYST